MADLAQLITSITIAVTVAAAIFFVIKPPALLRGMKWKWKNLELDLPLAELKPTPALPVAAPEQHGTAEPPPTPSAPAPPQLPEQTAGEERYFPKIMALLDEGKFKEGFDLAKKELAGAKDVRQALGHQAFYMYTALSKGSNDAFEELEQIVAAHPTNYGVFLWWGLTLQRAGRVDDAQGALQSALTNAATEAERVQAALTLANLLIHLERSAEATGILRQELERTSNPAERSSLYVGLSDVYETETPADAEKAFLMLELAIRSTPSDIDLRFRLAYDYSKHGANELAFAHYRVLLGQKADHVIARNNAGVAADGLSLPLTSVVHYEEARDAGSTLAAANLAKRLITAGFKKQAATILAEARKAKDIDRQVDSAAGQLAEAEADEESKIEQIKQRVNKVRKWRVEHAEAVLREPPSASEVSGSYTGIPSPLELQMADEGRVAGVFRFDTGKTATLVGTFEGAALAFKWSEVADKKDLYSFLGRKSGHGVLLLRKDRLDGYWAAGSAELDSADADKWTDWHLTKRTASPEALPPVPAPVPD